MQQTTVSKKKPYTNGEMTIFKLITTPKAVSQKCPHPPKKVSLSVLVHYFTTHILCLSKS